MALARTPPARDRKDQLHIRRIDLLASGNADRPYQATSGKTLSEWRTQAVSGVCQYSPKANACGDHPVNLRKRDLRLAARITIIRRERLAFTAA